MFKLRQFNLLPKRLGSTHALFALFFISATFILMTLNAYAQNAGDCRVQQCRYAVSVNEVQFLNDQLLVLDSAPLRWQIEDVHRAYLRGDFQPAAGRATARNSQMATWVRVELESSTASSGEWVLVSHSVSQRDLQLFVLEPNGTWHHRQSGLTQPFTLGRDWPYRHPNFRLQLTAEHPLVVYLRYEDPVGSIFPLSLKTPIQLEHLNLKEHWWFGIIFGVVIGLLLYNFLLMVQLREATYGWYVLSTAAVLLLIFDGTSLGLQYLTPDFGQPRWMDRTTAASLWGALVILFMQRLLNTRTALGHFHTLLSGLAITFLAITVLHQFGFDAFTTQATKPLALIGIVLLLSAAVMVLHQGNRTAAYFLLGHGVLLGAALLMVARNFGWVAPQALSTYIFPAAVAFECIVFSLALAHRIQTLQTQHQQAVKDAERDPLTNILNRRGLDRCFQEIVTQGKGEVALILLDLNRFKVVNDTYGHDVGDVLLQTVAERIQHATRGQDAVARLGGDEYAILLHHEHVNQAITRVTARLKKSFADPVVHQDITLRIDTSVGIAHCAAANADYNALYREADQALYQQKQKQKQKRKGSLAATSEAPE